LLSTRLVIVEYRASEASSEAPEAPHRLGLIVEGATQTRRIAREQFADTGVATPHARWLGPVASDELGMIQWIDVQQMLDDDVKALLFPQPQSHTR
jgi:chemotaxis-related protein WspB